MVSKVEEEWKRDEQVNEILDDDDDDDVIMTEEEVGVKCPYTQQVCRKIQKLLLIFQVNNWK